VWKVLRHGSISHLLLMRICICRARATTSLETSLPSFTMGGLKRRLSGRVFASIASLYNAIDFTSIVWEGRVIMRGKRKTSRYGRSIWRLLSSKV
jgi:hypothetical protein